MHACSLAVLSCMLSVFPAPVAGPLPLLPNACEHAALQEAVQDSSKMLTSTAERQVS